MTQTVFWKIGWRYLLRHPWQTVLMILGITLGVAVVVAIDLANTSASRAFDLSTEAVAGRATHLISGGPAGLHQSVYTRLRQAGVVEAAAPVISEYVVSPQLGEQPMQLLGVDPFAEAPFRSYLGDREGRAGSARPAPVTGDLIAFLTRPGAAFLSEEVAGRYGLQAGSQITIEAGGRQHTAWIAGLLQPGDRLSSRALETIILADIATAQEITGRLDRLDRIDLILPEEGTTEFTELAGQIRALLPADARLSPVEARSGAIEQMTEAFRVNLTALSLLALVVGLFLIYNTMTFSVVQRRPLFGTLRCLGGTRREIFTLVLSEALLVGVIGSLAGISLGIALGQGALRLVTQTINDLFFVVTVRGVQIPALSLIKGSLIGVLATLATAAPPAWEAASVPPRTALSRSGLESKARRVIRLAASAGLLLLGLGLGLLMIPTRSLIVSFAGTFAVIIGCAMLAPVATGFLMRLSVPIFGRAWGALGRMAPRDVINSLSRTSIAVSALMVAVSVTIGVSLMISSFRYTVVSWLEQTLQGDIYISPPGINANQTAAAVDPQIVSLIQNWPGVEKTYMLRSANVDSPQGPVHIAASSNPEVSLERSYLATDVPLQEIPAKMQQGAVIVSEPFASRLDLPRHGAAITLYTDSGPRQFPVVGIYYDYSSTQGTVTMALDIYRRHWQDRSISAIALRLAPGADLEGTTRALQAATAEQGQRLSIRPNQALRRDVLEVFDRTFAITGALQLLATIVAFIGVLSALLSLELERQRELGILRAIGMTIRQVWNLILLETGLLGFVAGVLAMPTGYILALILIFIINRRSFGWTLQMQTLPDPFLLALVVALSASLLAGILPAYRIGKMLAAEAIRYE